MKLLIIGAGEYGALVKELAQEKYDEIAFLDDAKPSAIGKINECAKFKDEYKNAIAAIGDNKLRMQIFELLKKAGFNMVSIISSKAYTSPSATIGEGCIIEANSTINIASVIKDGVIVCAGTVVNHNALVNKFCRLDCNSVVGSDCTVPELTDLSYGQLLNKVVRPTNWSFDD